MVRGSGPWLLIPVQTAGGLNSISPLWLASRRLCLCLGSVESCSGLAPGSKFGWDLQAVTREARVARCRAFGRYAYRGYLCYHSASLRGLVCFRLSQFSPSRVLCVVVVVVVFVYPLASRLDVLGGFASGFVAFRHSSPRFSSVTPTRPTSTETDHQTSNHRAKMRTQSSSAPSREEREGQKKTEGRCLVIFHNSKTSAGHTPSCQRGIGQPDACFSPETPKPPRLQHSAPRLGLHVVSSIG